MRAPKRTATHGMAAFTLAALVALMGCGGSNGKGRLSLSTRASAETAATPAAPAATGLALDAHVVLERVRIVIRDVKLESHVAGTGTTTTTTKIGGSDEVETETETEGDGEIEVKAGPVLIDLAADALTGAKLEEAVSVVIPDGSYDELKLKIHPLEDGETTGDADVDAARASVILDGTYDGAPFRFVSRVSAKQKLHGSFTVSADSPANITLAVDLSGWFTGPSGESLDPSAAASRSRIEENLRASFRAFEDDDRNGHDDQDDHGGHGGGADDGPNHT